MWDEILEWERGFRAAAEADNLGLFRKHLARLHLPDKPELLLDGTVMMMKACCAYAHLDGQSYAPLLELQKYDPCQVEDAYYSLTFDLFGKAYARIVTSTDISIIDLADLFNHPWDEYETAGYYSLWISRTDDEELCPDEVESLQEDVEADLRYDYTEDELDFWFVDSVIDGHLLVMLQDRECYEEDDLTEN